MLEKLSNDAFQALWIELSFPHKKSIVCGIVYRQHNALEQFQKYFEETIENFTTSGKQLCVSYRETNCPLKCFPCKEFSIFPLCVYMCVWPLCVYMCVWRLGRGEGEGGW